MALNPPVTDTGIPMSVPGERFLCHRTNIKASIELTQVGKMEASGQLFLTTKRVCFVVHKDKPKIPHSDQRLTSLDIPLSHITHQEFKQPIFGANNLQCTLNPVPSMGTHHPVKVKLEFRDGGCSLFVKLWTPLMQSIEPSTPHMTWEGFVERTDDFLRYVQGSDPNDPTQLYMQQPDVPTAPAIGPSGAGFAYYPAPGETSQSTSSGAPSAPSARNQQSRSGDDPPPYDGHGSNGATGAYRAQV